MTRSKSLLGRWTGLVVVVQRKDPFVSVVRVLDWR